MLRNSDVPVGAGGAASMVAPVEGGDLATALAAATVEAQECLAALRRELLGVVEASEGVVHDDSDPEGSTAFERAQLESLIASTEKKLEELADAGERLRAGAYGTCTGCGSAIAPERLAARPTATTCIGCASRRR